MDYQLVFKTIIFLNSMPSHGLFARLAGVSPTSQWSHDSSLQVITTFELSYESHSHQFPCIWFE